MRIVAPKVSFFFVRSELSIELFENTKARGFEEGPVRDRADDPRVAAPQRVEVDVSQGLQRQ